MALIATEGGTRRLAAVDDAAAALGLHVGQKAADAAALVPDLVTADHDPDGDRAALEILCDWCVRFSPAVAIDGLDGLLLDVEGVSHLWGGEAAMLDDLLARLERWGAPARGAIADTPGAAWALARYAPDRTIAPPGGQGRCWPPCRWPPCAWTRRPRPSCRAWACSRSASCWPCRAPSWPSGSG
jgi:protein ImuB